MSVKEQKNGHLSLEISTIKFEKVPESAIIFEKSTFSCFLQVEDTVAFDAITNVV
jgi:hypothetical protein